MWEVRHNVLVLAQDGSFLLGGGCRQEESKSGGGRNTTACFASKAAKGAQTPLVANRPSHPTAVQLTKAKASTGATTVQHFLVLPIPLGWKPRYLSLGHYFILRQVLFISSLLPPPPLGCTSSTVGGPGRPILLRANVARRCVEEASTWVAIFLL
jgi:hypothetical protein